MKKKLVDYFTSLELLLSKHLEEISSLPKELEIEKDKFFTYFLIEDPVEFRIDKFFKKINDFVQKFKDANL